MGEAPPRPEDQTWAAPKAETCLQRRRQTPPLKAASSSSSSLALSDVGTAAWGSRGEAGIGLGLRNAGALEVEAVCDVGPCPPAETRRGRWARSGRRRRWLHRRDEAGPPLKISRIKSSSHCKCTVTVIRLHFPRRKVEEVFAQIAKKRI